jgi:hypothetical protein
LETDETRYRDELNFAEFPLAALSSRPDGQPYLTFSDTIFDQGRGQHIVRKVTISPSAKHGLPTPMDDEVILGLVQLTSQQRFTGRTVSFTRYQLLDLLGWRKESKSYERLKESLFRWLGVTLQYEKAWWSKTDQRWIDKGFHLLDDVQLTDHADSSFTWNETVFRSFQSGYLKQIDFGFYRGLQSAVAKRMYRFLDKRFHQRRTLEFPLRTFACDHLGLGRSHHNGELKRLLKTPIAELETKKFLQADEARFNQVTRGEWVVRFARAAAIDVAETPPNGLVERLVAFGVTRSVAADLVATFPAERIRQQLDRMSTRGKGVRNLPGYLVQAIREDYAARGSVPKGRPIPKVLPVTPPAPEPAAPVGDDASFESFWQGLSTDQQAAFEAEAVRQAEPFLARQYHEAGAGSLFTAVRRQILRHAWAQRPRSGGIVPPAK